MHNYEDTMFAIMLGTQTNDHLAGLNRHYRMVIEKCDNPDKIKVSWGTVYEQTPMFIKFTIPKSFETTHDYQAWARMELNRIPIVKFDLFLN